MNLGVITHILMDNNATNYFKHIGHLIIKLLYEPCCLISQYIPLDIALKHLCFLFKLLCGKVVI